MKTELPVLLIVSEDMIIIGHAINVTKTVRQLNFLFDLITLRKNRS
jgi:hypothetical protein